MAACIPFWEIGDEVVCIRSLGGLFNFLLAGTRFPQRNVVTYGRGKQHRLLTNQPHLTAQPKERHMFDVLPIQEHLCSQ